MFTFLELMHNELIPAARKAVVASGTQMAEMDQREEEDGAQDEDEKKQEARPDPDGMKCLMQLLQSNEVNDIAVVDGMYKMVQQTFANPPSMQSFVESHIPDQQDHQYFTSALIAQGLQAHTSKTRKIGLVSLRQPRRVISEAVREIRLGVYRDKLAEKCQRVREAVAEERREKRRLLEEKARTTFRESHKGMPEMFTKMKVAEMNKTRPAHDQLEVMPNSSLFKHHCSFKSCVFYLQNLATPTDLKYGTRHGLFDHLNPMTQAPDWVNGFHIQALRRMRERNNEGKEEFTASMTTEFSVQNLNKQAKKMSLRKKKRNRGGSYHYQEAQKRAKLVEESHTQSLMVLWEQQKEIDRQEGMCSAKCRKKDIPDANYQEDSE